jgi:hypothetical protein
MQNLVFNAFFIFALYIALFSNSYSFAQSNETLDDYSVNVEKFTTSPNIDKIYSTNTTRIMENTSGMIDEAFDIIKDTFGSFFGK